MAPEPAAPRGILFDLDGTLIDSRRDIATALNRMRAERDLEALTVEQVGKMVGEGARRLVRKALPPTSSREEQKAALTSYLAHYADTCLDTTQAYPGVSSTLATLAPSFPLAVLTNKPEDLSRRILTALGLDRHLREVVGGDTLPTRKPNPGGVFLLADRMAMPASWLLLVGDSVIDAQTAKAGGCSFALALWGEGAGYEEPPVDEESEVEPAEPPAWRLHKPRDLAAALGLTLDHED